MVWLVALQFLLYAGAWALAGLWLPHARRPAAYWSGFMLLVGTGFWLTTLRGEPRLWLAYAGSGIAFITALLLLWRGMEAFFSLPHRHAEQALLLVVAVGTGGALGAGAGNAAWRVVGTYGLCAVVVMRVALGTHRAVAAEFGGRAAAHLVATPAYLATALLAGRTLHQLVDMGSPHELHLAGDGNERQLLGYLVGAAIFNFSFVALVVLRAVRRLETLSREDALTGLLNRRALDDAMAREWRHHRRTGDPLAVVALDLDHFKRVNDLHGHEAGDRVLAHAAQLLREIARGSDAVARAGGEEFVLVMPGADAEGAQAAAQRLLQRLRAKPCMLDDGPLAVTASAGVTVAGPLDSDAQDLLRRADQALYRAKTEGRDRVVQLS